MPRRGSFHQQQLGRPGTARPGGAGGAQPRTAAPTPTARPRSAPVIPQNSRAPEPKKKKKGKNAHLDEPKKKLVGLAKLQRASAAAGAAGARKSAGSAAAGGTGGRHFQVNHADFRPKTDIASLK